MEAIAKYMIVIAIVAAFTAIYTSENPGGPQLIGWNAMRNALANPTAGLNGSFAFNQNPNCGFDVGCMTGNVANAFTGFFTGIGRILSWLWGLLSVATIALVGIMTLTFSPPLPAMAQYLIWAFTIPINVVILFKVLSIVRGSE